MLNIYFFAFALFITILAFSKTYWSDKSFIYAFMVAYNLLYTFACIAIFAIAMQCCWKKVSASQFTLYMTIANLGQMVFAALIGPIRASFNWQYSLLAFAVFIMLAFLLLQFVDIDKQIEKVAYLEKMDLDE